MILKNSALLAIFSVISVLLGIFRDRLLATMVGVGPILDIYNAAFRLPDFLYALSLAFVTAGTVVPYLTVEDKRGHIIDARHKLSSISLFFGGVASLLGLVIAITIPLYAKLLVPGFTEEQVETFISVSRIMMIQPVLLGITSLISCFAQLKNQFVLYGISPLGYSLGIIFGIIELYPRYGVHGLIYGVLIGALFAFSIQAYSLRGKKMLQVLPYFAWHDIKELISLGLPRTGVNVLSQVRTMFFTAVATTFGPGALTSFIFAQRITDAITQVIQQSVTTASIPVLSKEFTEHRMSEYKSVVRRYVFALGAIGMIASFLVYTLQDAVVWLLYGSTEFKDLIVFFLKGFLIALPFTMMTGFFSISFYSAKDTKSVFYSNLCTVSLAIIAVIFTKEQGPISLVYGMIIIGLGNFLIQLVMYRKKKL